MIGSNIKYVSLLLLLIVSACNRVSLTISAVGDAPVASNISPAAFNQNTQSIITLSYSDVESNQATACSITATSNVSVTQACGCTAGVCTVGVTGTTDYSGAASFNYTVTANGITSSAATANLSITAVAGLTWAQEAYIKAVNADSQDWFGASVAISGDTLVVGSPYEDSAQTTITNGTSASADNTKTNSGAAYIYRRSGSIWAQEAYIKSSNSDQDDFFGESVSISGDTIVVGSFREDSAETYITNGNTASADNTKSNAGAVYVYRLTGSTWVQEAYIKASNADTDDDFAFSTTISGDTLVVSAPLEDSAQSTITNGYTASADNTKSASGAIFVYRRTGNIWGQEAYIKASNSDTDDSFGYSVSISGDTLAVGAYGEDSNQTTITNGSTSSGDNSSSLSGAAYVYRRTGTNWAQEAYIKASNAEGNEFYAERVSISNDTIVVGTRCEDSAQSTITNGNTSSADNSKTNSGAVYVYRRNGINWAQESYIKAANSDVNDQFGKSVSISGDTIVVGASYESSNQTTITSGTTASSDNSMGSAGAAYVYQRVGTSWTQEAYIKPAISSANYNFGASVSISGDTIAVGTYSDDSAQTTITNGSSVSFDNSKIESGAVYIYRNTNRLFEVPELTTSDITSNRITLNWIKSGGSATGYAVAYDIGSTAPSDCNSGTVRDVGNVSTFTESSLLPGTTYSFRVCSTENMSTFSEGVTISATTAQSGWVAEAYIKAANSDSNDNFGISTSISGDTIVVGAYGESSNQTTITNGNTASANNSIGNAGAVYVYRRTGTNWSQEAFIKAANTGAGDSFGNQTAISGDTIVVGVANEDSAQTTITNGSTANADDSLGNSGAVYVYRRTGNNWAQESYIKAVNAGVGDMLGASVSISGDTLVAGAEREDSAEVTITNGSTASTDNTKLNSGAAYVYRRTGSNWAQEAYIKTANADSNDNIIATSIDGDTFVLGAPYEDSNQSTITNGTTASVDNTKPDSGAAYVYRRTSGIWAQEAYIKAANADAIDTFGFSVSLSGDTIVVGAYQEDGGQTTITNGGTAGADNAKNNAGAAYVYRRTSGGWAQEAYLKASNSDAGDGFGVSTDISGDTIVVGSFVERSNQTTITNGNTASANNSASWAGAAYVYRRIGNLWEQEAYIKAPNAGASDYFASSVSISGDTIVVGAYSEESNQTTITNGDTASADNSAPESGAAYVFRNRSRLFEASELSATSTSSSVTLNWSKAGGSGNGYLVTYATGPIAPADCSAGGNVGNVLTYTTNSLAPSTTYTFRICSTDGSTYTSGMKLSVTTAP